MVDFPEDSIRKLGFTKVQNGEEIIAKFQSINIYSIRGLILEENVTLNIDINTHDDFKFAIGNSVNQLCKALVNDDYVENEDTWCKEKKVIPPYLVIHTELPNTVTASDVWLKIHDDRMITWDYFKKERQALEEREQSTIYKIISILSAVYSSSQQHVSFQKIGKIVFAETNYEKRLTDFYIQFQGEGYLSSPMKRYEISEKAVYAISLYEKLDDMVGYFFHSAAQESDMLKKFL